MCCADDHCAEATTREPVEASRWIRRPARVRSQSLDGEGTALLTRHLYVMWLACFFLVWAEPSGAEDPQIVISDALSANAERLKVNMGSKTNDRVFKVSFGDYAVGKGSRQVEGTSVSTPTRDAKEENIWQRVARTQAHYEFTLSDGHPDLATVEADNDVSVEESVRERFSEDLLPWSKETYWGSDQGSNRSQAFSAMINTSADDADTWVLIMATSEGRDLGHEMKASLSNGERQIQIVSTTSNKHGGDPRAWPALGYEFVEGEQTLCALQYDGGGKINYYKQLVWIDSRLDQRMKLVLAAAMTSLLQLPGIGIREGLWRMVQLDALPDS